MKLNENQLASGSCDKLIKIWDLNTSICLKSLNEHTGWVYSLVMLNENQLASGGNDTLIKIWDFRTSICL